MNVVADLDSSIKKLLSLAVDGVALVAVGVLVAILLLKAFRPAKFALMPFVVAPDLDPKLAAVARRSLQMELERGAVVMRRPIGRPGTAKAGAGGAIKRSRSVRMTNRAPDDPLAPAHSGGAKADERGRTNFIFKPAVHRIPFDDDLRDEQDPAFENFALEMQPVEFTEAIVVEEKGIKFLPLTLIQFFSHRKSFFCLIKVQCQIAVENGRLRGSAIVKRTLLFRMRCKLSVARIFAGGSRGLASTSHERTVALVNHPDLTASATALGVELAYVLLAAMRNAETIDARKHVGPASVKTWIEATAAYKLGVRHGDAVHLEAAVDGASRMLRETVLVEQAADLLIRTSNALLRLQQVEAAERALTSAYAFFVESAPGCSAANDTKVELMTRLGEIWSQQELAKQAVAILKDAYSIRLTTNTPLKGAVFPTLRIEDALVRAAARLERRCEREDALRFSPRGIALLARSEKASGFCEIADRFAELSLYDDALRNYKDAALMLESAGHGRSNYLLYRRGVMNRYLQFRSNTEQAKLAHRQTAEQFFRQVARRSESGAPMLQPDLRGRLNALGTPAVEAWYWLEALNDLGVLLLEKDEKEAKSGCLNEAQSLFERALAAAPNEWDLHNNLGLAYERHLRKHQDSIQDSSWSDPEEVHLFFLAKKSFYNAVFLAPGELLPRLNLALFLERAGAHDAALRHFTEAQHIAAARRGSHALKEVSSCVQGAARVLERLGRIKDAIDILECRARLDDRNPELALYLAVLTTKRELLAGRRDLSASLHHIWNARSMIAERGSKEALYAKALAARADEVEGYVYRCADRPGMARLLFERRVTTSEYARASLSLLNHQVGKRFAEKKGFVGEHTGESQAPVPRGRNSHVDSMVNAYDQARIASLMGYKDEALSCLRAALVWQPGTRNWVVVDPDFERLADDPDFTALVGLKKPGNKRPSEVLRSLLPSYTPAKAKERRNGPDPVI